MPKNVPVRLVAQYPEANHHIVHISDTQLLGETGLWHGFPVDADKLLQDLIVELEASNVRPEALIFTGDLADAGEPAAYQKLIDLVEPVAARLGAQLIWVMGNHDRRPAFRELLLKSAPSMAPVDQVIMLKGLRIITLDTSVPGEHFGLLSEGQLNWLRKELAVAAPEGTIIAMHHPPLPSVLPLAQTVELQNQALFSETILGTDVRSIIAGHLHYSCFGMFAGIPVSVASSACYTQDLDWAAGGTRPRNTAQAYNFVDVYADTILHSVVPIGASEPVGTVVSPSAVTEILIREGLLGKP